VIAAAAASAAIHRAEPRRARMLVESGNDVVAIAPDLTRRKLLAGAGDAAPDGTLVAFARSAGNLRASNSLLLTSGRCGASYSPSQRRAQLSLSSFVPMRPSARWNSAGTIHTLFDSPWAISGSACTYW
jgi:hypothetical protein